jgi:hypothetical protein
MKTKLANALASGDTSAIIDFASRIASQQAAQATQSQSGGMVTQWRRCNRRRYIMSHHPIDRRNRERPVQAATIDRRHQKAQKSAPQRLPKPPQGDPTRGAAVGKPGRFRPFVPGEQLPGVPARPPER